MNKKNLILLTAALLPVMAMAEGALSVELASTKGATAAFWAAGMCMAIAAAVAAFSQSRAASAALEGIGRNPESAGKSLVPLLLGLALMESIALFAFLVANNLIGAITG